MSRKTANGTASATRWSGVTAVSVRSRGELGAVDRLAAEIVKLNRKGSRLRAGLQRAEELEALGRRAIRFHAGRNPDELHFGAERRVECAGAEGSRVERPGHEFPERIEIRELRARRVVVMRSAVVDVGGYPDDIPDPIACQVAEKIRELELASERRAGIAVRHRFVAPGPVADDQAERQ